MTQNINQALEAAILNLLDKRGPGKTICPSDAARHVDPANWRPLMDATRVAAQRLVAQKKLVATQKGKIIDATQAKGPIRFARVGGPSCVKPQP